MTLTEAYDILEVDSSTPDELVKANYRWLIKFFHPDLGIANNPYMISKLVEAFNIVSIHRQRHNLQNF